MNPVLISLGGFDIHYYTVIVLVVVYLGIALAQKEAKRFGVKKDFIFNMCFWAVIFGMIAARAYYVLFHLDYFSQNVGEILMIWTGGLAIHGAIIGGLITVYLYCKKYKARFIRYLDFMVVPLLIAQALGRWGNFFNGEAHGVVTTPEQISNFFTPDFVVRGMNIDGAYYVPTFYYEFLACLILFIVMLFLRRSKYIKVGSLTAIYLIGYGVIRFFIEMSRTDALMIGAFKTAQIVSVIMVLIGVIIIMINTRKGKFEDLYNDTNNIEESLY